MRNRIVGLGAVVALAVGLGVWWAARDTPTNTPEAAPEPTSRRVTRAVPGTGPTPDAEPAANPSARDTRDVTPVEQALTALAAAEGHGRVACPLPSDAGDAEVRHRRSERIGDTVHFTVADAEGTANVHRAAHAPDCTGLEPLSDAWSECFQAGIDAKKDTQVPIGRFAWTDAWPGERGVCRYQPVEIVEMRGHVTTASGEVPTTTSVSGCVAAHLDDDGSFVVEAVKGEPCVIGAWAAMVENGRPLQTKAELKIDAASARSGLVLELADVTAMGNPADAMRDLDIMGMIDEQRERPNPLVVALESDGLSDEARAVLQGWRDEELKTLDDMADMALQVEDLMAETEAILEEARALQPGSD